ncbi:MAG: hypothetical protein WCS70_02890 [Verrucomicrobiota bacterium]
MKPTVKFFSLATLAITLTATTRVTAANGTRSYASNGSSGQTRSSYSISGGVSSGGYSVGGSYSSGNYGAGYPRPYCGTGYYGGAGYPRPYSGAAYYGGGCGKNYWGWSGYVPWNLSFSYSSAPAAVYYAYSPPPVTYQPTVVYSSAPAVVYSAPPVVYTYPPPPATAPATPQSQPPHRLQSISVADVKALAKAGLSDEVIISQIRSAQTVFHLSTAEIIDLKENAVSEKVINCLINTASTAATNQN